MLAWLHFWLPPDQQSLWYLQVLKRVPTLKKLDGQPVDVEEREAASK